MSGIIGVAVDDALQPDIELVKRLTAPMAFRGPSATGYWCEPGLGVGYTQLPTGTLANSLPFANDGSCCVIADARLDDRNRLTHELGLPQHGQAATYSDAALILLAYRKWGANCVSHLTGDFSFAVWDRLRRQLFCGRDQLGVRPFYYAVADGAIVFGNTLAALRQHGQVSSRLDELAVADFLLFEMCQDPASTMFADVRKLPAAHTLTWRYGDAPATRRYWELSIGETISYRHRDDYCEEFLSLLKSAVADRLPATSVALLMSGGVDSTALAATVCEVLGRSSGAETVCAFTTTIPDLDNHEIDFARLAATGLNIRHEVRELPALLSDERWQDAVISTPEPTTRMMTYGSDRRAAEQIAAWSPVCFYGEGPDNAMQYEWRPYVAHQLRHRRFTRLALDLWWHLLEHRRVASFHALTGVIVRRGGDAAASLRYPEWLDRSFAGRLKLEARWQEFTQATVPPTSAARPRSLASFTDPGWEHFFSALDAEWTGAPLEFRHPFVDLRVLDFALRLPAVPWCREKLILRRAMRRKLPAEVLARPKTPLSDDPSWVGARRTGLRALSSSSLVSSFVNPGLVPTEVGDPLRFRVDCRPLALNSWLSQFN